jgi:hypothetical protein
MPQSPQSDLDPEFWERLRGALKAFMSARQMKQCVLAPMLGIKPSTLNNFLNHESDTLGGLAVAFACAIGVEVVCNGDTIGKLSPSKNGDRRTEMKAGTPQLVLEFDESFEVQQRENLPIVVLRKPPSREGIIRLRIARK